ncbi:MAG: DNA gyrase subunit A, partial [Candidatus Gracilibacteria bacterium]|nr:DNA gyrase subunit A [Candidatus Gracilibacteria bacterium]
MPEQENLPLPEEGETPEIEAENTEEKIEFDLADLSTDSTFSNENLQVVPASITPILITDDMQTSYLNYAMSVIVSRALPDVRDGLKPVHRRILYAMHDIGLRHSSKHRKSAKIVGEVLGKYHPHGDSAVYDSMVRMAQDFSMRYMLVDGQGNFGSMDGDSAAAMRYTEARMQRISDELLVDIEKETVDFRDNYDGSEKEPSVLPAKLPQLLLNGTEGIAVGMATRIPPHNLGEVVDAIMHLSKNPDCTVEDLAQFVQGPDFPTGGMIYGQEDILHAYMTGRGKIAVRGKADIEELKNGRFRIIIRELPFQVNKATLIEKMANLVQDKKIIGISDLRDESDKQGVRVVVELKKDAYPKKVLNRLYKLTSLQTAFHLNMIALVDGIQPRLLNLKSILEYYLIHRKEVVTRRTQYELKIAKARAHILEGLKIALDNIDAVIQTIRKSETKEKAHESLMKKFKLSEKQATAILEMRLQTLAGLERKKIDDEYAEKIALITDLERILADEKEVLKIIQRELAEIKEKYADERRTKVYKKSLKDFSDMDLIPDEEMVITLTENNYIKRVAPSVFKSQHRGGKGIMGMATKEEDSVEHILITNTHDEILLFTNKGRVFKLKVYEVPQFGRAAKGQALANLVQVAPDEKVTAMISVSKKEEADKYYFMATKKGVVKKSKIEDFKNVRQSGLIAIKLRPGDELHWVRHTSGENEIMMVTRDGQSIRFLEKDVRSMGRASTGVRGVKLRSGDEVVRMMKIKDSNEYVMTVSENGLGKLSALKDFKVQNRGGSGIKV